MDFASFKWDIDDLINEFAEKELTTFADMKKVWLGRKFSYIFEGRPSTNVALFMQTLYSHSLSFMISSNSLSHRLGSLYCLYCLYETQPFKHPFKIYLSLGGLRRLKALVVTAKEMGIKVVSDIVRKMLEKKMFLFGSVDINEYSEKERIKELVNVQNSCIQKMHEKLFADTEIERYLHMDLGMELDLDVLMKISSEYAGSKNLAIREASQVVDVENIRHLAEDRPTIGDEVQKITVQWGGEKELFSQQIAWEPDPAVHHPAREDDQRGQVLRLPAAEQGLSDDGVQHPSFMELLMGDESPQANGDERLSAAEENNVQDDDTVYAKELENQLFDDGL